MRSLGLIVMLLAAVPAAAQQEDNRSPNVLTGRGPGGGGGDALADLQSVLDPRTPPYVGTSSIAFFTRPYGTEYRGLCRRDMLILNYGSEIGDNGPDQVTKPYQLRTIATFHLLRQTVKELELDYRRRDIGEGECPAFRDPKANWFEAPSAYMAVFGYRAMRAAVARMRAGTLESVKCVSMQDDEPCAKQIIRLADSDQYQTIGPCAKESDDNECVAIRIYSITVEIRVGRGTDGTKAEDVESITAEDEGIVVT
ncbi:MAG: hypothetical protein ACAH11_10765 [Sphingomonas sp.]